MPRWTPASGVDRARQSLADKKAVLERLLLREAAPPQVTPYSWGNIQWPTAASDIMRTITANTTEWTSTWTQTATAANNLTASIQDWTMRIQDMQYYNNPRYGSTPAWVWESSPAPVISQEEADRRLAATREAQHKSAIRRKKAIKKGRKLLLEVLTDEQMYEYAQTKSFTVYGKDGKVYKVRKSGTTHQMENGVPAYSHCIHLPYSYIDEDTLVAVKLLLETDSKMFHKIANTTKLAAPAPVIQIAQPHEVAHAYQVAA